VSGSQLPPPFCRLYPVPRPSSLTVPFPSAPNQVIHPTRFIIVNRGFSGPESAAPGRELPARGRDPLVRFRTAQRRFAVSAHRSPVPAAAFHLLPSVTSNSHSDSLSSETLSGWPCHAVHYNEPTHFRFKIVDSPRRGAGNHKSQTPNPKSETLIRVICAICGCPVRPLAFLAVISERPFGRTQGDASRRLTIGEFRLPESWCLSVLAVKLLPRFLGVRPLLDQQAFCGIL
jgi:hypothetical protein